jgi:beta-1,4-mannosyltransferase
MSNSQAHITKGYYEGYFFSPRPDHRVHNNYINNFYYHLTQKVEVINQHDKVMGRSTELIKYAPKTKVLVLNWPEDIVHLRFGWLQALIFNLGILLIKARGGKVVWVCHNKKSHATGNAWVSQLNRSFFMHIADKIIVHSRDAVTTLKKVRYKTIFLPHPRYERIKRTSVGSDNKQQALIWGNITPYKGLEAFIEDYKKWQAQMPVHIVGRAGYHNKKAASILSG